MHNCYARSGWLKCGAELVEHPQVVAVAPVLDDHAARCLPAVVATGDAGELAVSCVEGSASGDIIVKLVRRAGHSTQIQLDLGAAGPVAPQASCTVVAGDPLAENKFGSPPAIAPQSSLIDAGPQFAHEAPLSSLSIIRLRRLLQPGE